MEKYKNRYRISTARLAGYDYGSHGLYYVTICTKNREHFFGEIFNVISTNLNPNNNYNNQLYPTKMANIADQNWSAIPMHYPFVELDEYVIMPNHIHAIIFFNLPNKTDWTPNKFGTQSKNLGAVIRGFKSTTKRYANENDIDFEWQPSFYDHIIQDEKSLNKIRQYIISNQEKWANDEFNRNVSIR